MPLADYLGGLALWGAGAACAAGTATLLLAGRAPAVRGAPRVLAWSLLFIAATLAALMLPGVLGLLSRPAVLASAVALLGAAWLTRERGGLGEARSARGPAPSTRLEWALAGAAVAFVAWLLLAALIERAPVPPTNLDALTFHLPGIATWIADGGFWHIGQWVPDLAHGNYPQSGDVLDMSVILPWENDAFVRLTGFPLLALAALAVYAIGVELGARRAPAAAWAAAFASMPSALQPAALEVLTDDLLLASLGTGLLFLVRHVRTGARADLVLAGLGLGIAFGTKWYGVSSVVVIVAVWAAAELLARTPARLVVRRVLALAGLVAAAGGFWLVRNWVESGNPIFPVEVAPLGIEVFDAPFDRVRAEVGFAVVSYLDDPGVLADYIVPALERTVALPGVVFGLAAVAALLVAVPAAGREGGDRRVPALAVTSLALAAAYSATPYSALGAEGEPLFTEFNVRYLVPALLAAAPLAAWLSRRLPVPGWAGAAAALLATAQAGRLTAEKIGATPLVQAAVALALLAAAGWACHRLLARPGRVPRRVAAAAAAVLALGAVLSGQELQSRFNESRYVRADPAFAWAAREPVEGSTIGLVGVWGVARESPVWPMFGPRLENEVVYVGEFRRGMLRDYRTRAGMLEGVGELGVDYLLVARGEPPRPTVRQVRWARAGGLRQVLRSERFTLFAVPGRG